MATAVSPVAAFPADWTLADLQAHLGGIPPERIRLYPYPGTASEEDVQRIGDREKRRCELIDGVLVEKAIGWYESALAGLVIHFLHDFLGGRRLGMVLGEAGALRILPDMVRIPDVSFIRRERLAEQTLVRGRIPPLAPNLAVEILSESNTAAEMQRTLHDYFEAGVELVWYIDPRRRTATVFTSADRGTEIGEDGVLDGGDVLPGFRLVLRDLFAAADRQVSGGEPSAEA